MPIRSGSLNTLVEIQQYGVMRQPPLYEPKKAWSQWRRAYCDVEPRRGRETHVDGKTFFFAVYRLHFRFSEIDGIDSAMRVILEGQPYNIVGIFPHTNHRDIRTIEVVTQQN